MPGTTPVYGFPYPEPTDLVADYPALGQDLAEDVEAALQALPAPGLTFVSNTAFTASAAVNINNCFTSTYEQHLMVIEVEASNTTDIYMRLRVSGTDSVANYENAGFDVRSNNSTSIMYFGAATQWQLMKIGANRYSYNGSWTILHAAQARWSRMHGTASGETTGTASATTILSGGHHFVATAYDGMTLYPSAGTITGNVRIYGLRDS